jgi:hypothetical protein
MKLVLERFGAWIEEAPGHRRAMLSEALPDLAPVIGELGASRMQELLAGVNRIENDDAASRLLAVLRPYGTTDAPTVMGLYRIAARALALGMETELDTLVSALPVDSILEDDDAMVLMPALADCGDQCAAAAEGAWPNCLRLAAVLTARSFGSALVAARKLPAAFKALDQDAVGPYLAAFASLVEAIGTRTTGYGIRRLPRIFAKHGPERTGMFVQAALDATQRYGIAAGEAVLERRTRAARELLSRG